MLKTLIQRLGAALALLAILASYGGHWGALQTVAWSGMLLQYSRDAGLVQGIQDTFDGEHPCHLCLQISEARQQGEPTSQLATTSTHPPVRHFATSVQFLAPAVSCSTSTSLLTLIGSNQSYDRPPTPPPRARA